MKPARLLFVVLLFTAVAFAWPLMGSWRGELNGKPITITLQRGNAGAEGTFAVGPGGAAGSAQQLRIANLKVREGGRSLTFQVPNQTGAMKLVSSGPEQLTFQLDWTGEDQASLRSVDDPNAPPIKMTHAKSDAR